MRCKDVKQWMIEQRGEFSAAVIEHISQCESCARAARANRKLDDLFAASSDTEQVPSFSAIRERVESLAGSPTTQEKIMSYIKNQVRTRPALLAGASLAIVVFLFVTLVPISYTHTAGYTISVTDSKEEDHVTLQKVEKAIEDADVDNVTLVVSSEGDVRHYTIASKASREVADRIAVVLSEEIDEHVTVSVEPVVTVKSDPIYAQVVSRVKVYDKERPRVRIQLPQTLLTSEVLIDVIEDLDLDDAEVERQLSERLIEQGLSSDEFEVSSETKADAGTRIIKLTLPSDNDEAGEMEIEFSIGQGKLGSERKSMALYMKSGKIMKVDMADDEELDGNIIIMKVSTDDTTR